MPTPPLLTYHLVACRKLLGLEPIEMALHLALSPLAIILAEGDGAKSPVGLMRPLPNDIESQLTSFLCNHPMARVFFTDKGTVPQSELQVA